MNNKNKDNKKLRKECLLKEKKRKRDKIKLKERN